MIMLLLDVKKEDKILNIGYGTTHNMTFTDQNIHFKVDKIFALLQTIYCVYNPRNFFQLNI